MLSLSSQRGPQKKQNGRFLSKIAIRLKKVCYKVSLCETVSDKVVTIYSIVHLRTLKELVKSGKSVADAMHRSSSLASLQHFNCILTVFLTFCCQTSRMGAKEVDGFGDRSRYWVEGLSQWRISRRNMLVRMTLRRNPDVPTRQTSQ